MKDDSPTFLRLLLIENCAYFWCSSKDPQCLFERMHRILKRLIKFNCNSSNFTPYFLDEMNALMTNHGNANGKLFCNQDIQLKLLFVFPNNQKFIWLLLLYKVKHQALGCFSINGVETDHWTTNFRYKINQKSYIQYFFLTFLNLNFMTGFSSYQKIRPKQFCNSLTNGDERWKFQFLNKLWCDLY